MTPDFFYTYFFKVQEKFCQVIVKLEDAEEEEEAPALFNHHETEYIHYVSKISDDVSAAYSELVFFQIAV